MDKHQEGILAFKCLSKWSVLVNWNATTVEAWIYSYFYKMEAPPAGERWSSNHNTLSCYYLLIYPRDYFIYLFILQFSPVYFIFKNLFILFILKIKVYLIYNVRGLFY